MGYEVRRPLQSRTFDELTRRRPARNGVRNLRQWLPRAGGVNPPNPTYG